MKKYIEMEKAILRIKEYAKNVYGVNLDNSEEFAASNSKRENYCEGLYEATEIINDDVPAADVREVIHAKWENIEPYVAINGKYLKAQICGNCGAYFVSNGNKPYSNHPYCCECGAQMDGE